MEGEKKEKKGKDWRRNGLNRRGELEGERERGEENEQKGSKEVRRRAEEDWG